MSITFTIESKPIPTNYVKMHARKGKQKSTYDGVVSHDQVLEIYSLVKKYLTETGATMITSPELSELRDITKSSASQYLNLLVEYGYANKRRTHPVTRLVSYSLTSRTNPESII